MFRSFTFLLLLVAISYVLANEEHHDEEAHDVPSKDHEEHHEDSEHHSEDDHHKDEEHGDAPVSEEHHDEPNDEHHDDHNEDQHDEHHEEHHDGGELPSNEDHGEDPHQSEKVQLDDHDAFLGDHVAEFKKLMEEDDRKKKLDEIVKTEIDTDKDGFVSEDELRARFKQTTKTHRRREVEDTLKHHDDDKDGKVSWAEFQKNHYGGENETAHDEAKENLAHDEKRFQVADTDGDKLLNVEEYHAFYHPVDDERMANHAIDEHLEKHDTDKDGTISLEEYLKTFNDMNKHATEELKKDFEENYDTNKDGKLDRTEMRHWVIPEDEFATEEPKKLMKEADDDKDNKLSLDEIHKHLNLFMDVPDTDENEMEHDEL